MGTRLGELALLFSLVCAATFLLSKVAPTITTPPVVLPLPSSNPYTRLIRQPPDEFISIPVASIRVRQIATTWHARRSGRRRHEGEDIFAPAGTPVNAATAGILIRMGGTKKGGNGVSVLGAGGRVYYYAHLAAFAKNLRVGSAVPKGTLLGYVGTSGNAAGTPAHLHFGVYDFTVAIDPQTLMQDAPSSRRLY